MFMVSIFGLLSGGVVYISQYKHLLIMLISLEMMALSLFWMMSIWFFISDAEKFFMLVFLSLVACEGSLGLAILVSMVRFHGSDKFEGISTLVC
uniref:NADH-ubiquinone oxidoreductase chain 4L n=1 Tax=Lithobius maqinensis TaxID=2250572 RepID=Q9G3Z9_9MYRI|nr:NADH dehydrogenase subunit 4L [Lithobius forficatus]AAG39994.1 NADH dehydrogenase subunit 4L [Lithobius forficatus]